MKSIKKGFSKVVTGFCTLLALVGCGSTPSNSPYLPGTPTGVYDPNQANTYQPKPDTHGYDPNTPMAYRGKTFSILRNVFMRIDPEIGVNVRYMEGDLEPKRVGDPVIFDDVRSFTFNIYRAQLLIDSANISKLKNKYTFNYPDCPLKEVQINFTPGRIKMAGKMKQVIWLPFEMEGTLTTTASGELMMTPDKIVAGGISSKGLMDLLGIKTSKLLQLSAERGVRMEGNNIYLNPELLFPPPKIKGRVVATEILQDQLLLVFDSTTRAAVRPAPDPNLKNYMHVYGGNVLIMNELQRGAELQMIDMDQSNAFDFYMAEYKRHLKAGYVKVANDAGSLLTVMPDYMKINSTSAWDQYPGGRPPGNLVRSNSVSTPNTTVPLNGYMPASEFWKNKL